MNNNIRKLELTSDSYQIRCGNRESTIIRGRCHNVTKMRSRNYFSNIGLFLSRVNSQERPPSVPSLDCIRAKDYTDLTESISRAYQWTIEAEVS